MSAASPLSRAVAVIATLIAAAVPLAVVPHAAGAGDEVVKVDAWASGTGAERRERARAALDRVEAIEDGSSPQAEKASGTLARRDLRVAMRDLGTADQARAEALLARPSTTDRLCNIAICVHFTTAGVNASTPAFAQTVLDTVDDVSARVEAGGYARPKDDSNSHEDPQLDVYLEDLGAEGLYGYCDSDDAKLNDPMPDGYDVSAYCGFDNDFAPSQFGGAPALDSLHVTVAHEYFHAVQFAYDYLEDGWFMEATATWMEDQLYDAVNDNRQYLSTSPLSAPGRSLDRFGDNYHYGAWLFIRYLSERLPADSGTGLPGVIREIWDWAKATSGASDYTSIEAIARVLSDRKLTFTAEFARFAMANRSPRTFYSEGAAYPKAAATTITVPASRRNPAATARVLDHLGAATVRYVPSRTTASDWRLRVALNMASRARGSAAVVRVFLRSGSVSTLKVALNSNGDATVSVPFSSGRVTAVEVTLVNASRRYVDCWADPTPYSCSGVPVDDDLRQVVDPLAYRA